MKQKTPPVKLKFWQKACAVLWGAFLVCLAMVCGAVYFWGKEQSYESELSAHLNDQAVMIQQLAKDVSALESRGSNALPALWRVYGRQYEAHHAALEIYENGQQAYSGLSEACIPQAQRQELLVQPGQRMRLVYATPAGRRLFIAAALPESLGQIVVVYSADMEPFYRQWEQILQLLCLAGGMAAVVYAAVLYALLRWMYQPLEKVTSAARALGCGQFSARAAVNRRDEFGELASALNGMADTVQSQMGQLQAVADQRQRLLENMAHELRTPLAAVSGWAETMRGVHLSPEEQAEALDSILFESRRAAELSRRMLELSVLQHDAAIEKKPVAVPQLLQHVQTAMLPLAKNRGVALQVGEAAFETVPGDGALLESLLGNLCENAIKASSPGGVVQLGGEIRDKKCFWVRDYGRGMSRETLENLGQPFYREDKARSRREGGAGLGVALCFEIARQHGARLQYFSRPGEGTLAMVEFEKA